MLRPRRLAEEAQGRPAESEAFCGKQQRCSTNLYFTILIDQKLYQHAAGGSCSRSSPRFVPELGGT
ncbi:hypothetical protein B4U37_02295 [Sutcliffiella horikoshii]|uniref:Uncharacterized protein n=1 Tax=Sutcliffiella horikoshii TaxID=79883 RepID=A0ABM6KF14_9BACI|nr:hypothetical protein B4U37_02295 [Sutcliffiella horikoshii]